MLGRYLAGTLLILGAAMIVAPEAPKREKVADSPASSDPSPQKTMAVASRPLPAPEAEVEAETQIARESEALRGGVEEAVVAALQLDLVEDAAEPDEPLTETASTKSAEGVFDGMSLLGLASRTTLGTAAAIDSGQILTVTGNRVNVRSGPSTQYRVVGSVVLGDEVELVSFEDDGWARVRMGGGDTGYMSRQFLSGSNDG
ncbi:SH3 domain-containing protein [Aliiruegeria haliotis]|uniref:SH3 domain-containing protein n=1 Tax=Aliiruegeria haliotis TaxID=1280846 RepID=A0A2T0RGI7_9RHOB|nr:SH3 domain-containing protein [Aliiruegeria haliotis]PRY20275.1 SH3 domain-containing protein [Aliiruegeria haliotis]